MDGMICAGSCSPKSSVVELVGERLSGVSDGYVVLAVFAFGCFCSADDFCGYAKRFALGDDGIGRIGIAIDLHAVAHVVDAKHFFVAGAAGFLNGDEYRRNG